MLEDLNIQTINLTGGVSSSGRQRKLTEGNMPDQNEMQAINRDIFYANMKVEEAQKILVMQKTKFLMHMRCLSHGTINYPIRPRMHSYPTAIPYLSKQIIILQAVQ